MPLHCRSEHGRLRDRRCGNALGIIGKNPGPEPTEAQLEMVLLSWNRPLAGEATYSDAGRGSYAQEPVEPAPIRPLTVSSSTAI